MDETLARCHELAEQHGLRVFAVIDQDAAAREHGLSLRATRLVIFGSPLEGTPVMQAAPLSALDLPLKLVIWDDEGTTRVSYTTPGAIAARYGLSTKLATRLEGIESFTDRLVANGA